MKRNLGIATLAVLISVAAWALWPAAGVAAGPKTDHALFDTTNPTDTGARCRTTNGEPFLFFASVRAFGGAATMRVTFQDGDFIDYTLGADESFSLQQAAGGTAGVDNAIRVTAQSGDLVGWVSASRAPGSRAFVRCTTLMVT
jgi:hypothetical protein